MPTKKFFNMDSSIDKYSGQNDRIDTSTQWIFKSPINMKTCAKLLVQKALQIKSNICITYSHIPTRTVKFKKTDNILHWVLQENLEQP